MPVPTVLCGEQRWIMKNKELTHLVASEIKSLRSVKDCITEDKIRNKTTRQIMDANNNKKSDST